MRRVKCSLVFYYDEETYLNEFAVIQTPSDKEIFRQCAMLMIEDITSTSDPIHWDAVITEFVEDNNAASTNT